MESFSFLENELGYRVVKRNSARDSFEVDYGGSKVGVRITYALRDPLAVFVCLLEDGVFPELRGEIRADTFISMFDLLDIETEAGVSQIADDEYSIPTRASLERAVERLRLVGQGLLEGDLSMVPALQARVRERAKNFAFMKWGDGASEFGW